MRKHFLHAICHFVATCKQMQWPPRRDDGFHAISRGIDMAIVRLVDFLVLITCKFLASLRPAPRRSSQNHRSTPRYNFHATTAFSCASRHIHEESLPAVYLQPRPLARHHRNYRTRDSTTQQPRCRFRGTLAATMSVASLRRRREVAPKPISLITTPPFLAAGQLTTLFRPSRHGRRRDDAADVR